MDATIDGEDGDNLKIFVTDNTGVEHNITFEISTGEIVYHAQDGYEDKAAKRTDAENERVKQARRYARYHVFREQGYPTLDPAELPEGSVVAATAIAQLPAEEFEAHFGEYHRQLRSVVEADVEPVVEIPEDDVAGLRVFLLSVHLGVDLQERLDPDALASLTAALDTRDDPDAVIEAIADQLGGLHLGPDALSIAGVSDVGVLYQRASGEVERAGDDPHPGPADARLELSPTRTPDGGYLPLEGFQVLVVHHLLCQARDRYLAMGLEPPESLRVLGLGTYRQTVRNEHLDLYQPVHATTEPVEGYALPEVGTHLESI